MNDEQQPDPEVSAHDLEVVGQIYSLKPYSALSPVEWDAQLHRIRTDKASPYNLTAHPHKAPIQKLVSDGYEAKFRPQSEEEIRAEQTKIHREGQEKLEKAKAEKLEKDRIRAVEDLKSEFGPRYQTILEQADEAFDSLPADLQGKLESANVLQRSKFVKGLSMVREAIAEAEAERSGKMKVTYEKG